MTDKTILYISVGALAVSLLIVGLVTTPNTIASTIDTGTDRPPILINNGISSGLPCNYNIIQVVGGITRNIQAINCITGIVDFQNTNATTLFQSVFNQISSNGGGVVHVTGYSTNSSYTHAYNISGAINLPASGHLVLYGDGPERTWFKVASGSDNAIFQYTGAKTKDVYFSVFRDFGLQGNGANVGTNTRGFYLNTTGFGYIDNLWDDLFLRDFNDAFYFGAVDCWNNKINNSAIELSKNGMNIGGSVTMGLTCADTKVISSKFLYNTVFGITSTARQLTVTDCFFYKNQQTAFKVNGLARAVIADNRFMDNSNGTNNGFYDIDLDGNNNVIVGNQFYGGEPGNNLVKYSLLVDTFENNNEITGNDFTGGNVGTARVFTLFTSQTLNKIVDNQGYNPFGIVSQPFTGTVIIPNSGTSSTPTNATDYTVNNSPVIIDSTGGVGVSITLKDGSGNTITSGLVTLSNLYVPMGDKIRFTFVNVPTVTVAFQ